MAESIVLQKAIRFALRIIGLYKYLTEQKREFVISKQILLTGVYIAKHVKTALYARSKDGFSSELWLLLLNAGDFITDEQYGSLNADCVEMIKLTSSISKTSHENE